MTNLPDRMSPLRLRRAIGLPHRTRSTCGEGLLGSHAPSCTKQTVTAPNIDALRIQSQRGHRPRFQGCAGLRADVPGWPVPCTGGGSGMHLSNAPSQAPPVAQPRIGARSQAVIDRLMARLVA
jgi:hypothetical protein